MYRSSDLPVITSITPGDPGDVDVPHMLSGLAIHIAADNASAGDDRRWPFSVAAADTVQRAARICDHLGVAEQHTLAGNAATTAAVTAALTGATTALAAHGALVLTFSGHTRRGDGPIEDARWCLFDGGLALSEIAGHLARLPGTARVLIITDTCYATAISQVLTGPQRVAVIASCGDDQTMIERRRSEFVVQLEQFLCVDERGASRGGHGSLEALRTYLEADTPDCERPSVWTNTASWWSANLLDLFLVPGALARASSDATSR